MTPEELESARWLLGPWLVGCFLDVFLQGILYCQFARYAARCQGDKWGMKVAVIILAIMTTLKTIHSFALIWIQSIEYFTDLQGAIGLSYTAWWQTGTPLIVATMGLYVQTFFCRRLYYISGRKWWVVAPVATILAFAYASMCIATYYITQGVEATPLMAPWFAAHFSSVFAGDMSVTLAMTYFLLKSRSEVLRPQTIGLLTALIRLTWLSVAPAALCAMFNLVFSQVWKGSDRLLSTTFNLMLPKLYAISMMWTLNARERMRAANNRYSTTAGHNLKHIANNSSNTAAERLHAPASQEPTEEIDTFEVRGMFHPKGSEPPEKTSVTGGW